MSPGSLLAGVLWLAGAAGLVGVLGVQTRWGTAVEPEWAGVPSATPAPVVASALPDFQLETPIDKMPETVSRTLFNPTRRPAPPPPVPQPPEPPKPEMKKGQFTLMGTSIAGDRKFAMLRELASGKVHRVAQGAVVNQITIAEVSPDRVVLAALGDTEEIVLRVAAGRPPPSGQVQRIPGGERPSVIPIRPRPGLVAPGAPPAPRVKVPDLPASPPTVVPQTPMPVVPAPPAVRRAGEATFLRPPPELPSSQALRDAAAQAEWRRLDEQIREQQRRATPQ